MALKPGLRLSQTQRLTLTPGLRQSLTILQMPALELETLVKTELAENPMLLAQPTTSRAANDYDFALETVAETVSLADYLSRQIALETAPAPIRALATYLAHDLDERGYIQDSPEAIAQNHGLSLPTVNAAIVLLQSCDPPGIGARNLAECLGLQLRDMNQPLATRQLITEHLPLFAARDWDTLAKLSGQPRDEILKLADLLHSLTANPAAGVGQKDVNFRRPDISVTKKQDGSLEVALIGSAAFSLKLDNSLISQVNKTTSAAFLAQKSRAQALIRALEQRSRTILRAATAIVEIQARFFLDPESALIPLTRRQLASRLNLHPSTVSRAISNKSLECAQGVYPLGFFFPTSVPLSDGRKKTSSHGIKQQIAQLIATEVRDKILSDAEISAILRQSGVDIARRTVAKYRQCLKIPSSTERRKSKRFL